MPARPALGVTVTTRYPLLSRGPLLTLPKGCIGFQGIHHEFAGTDRLTPVIRDRADPHYRLRHRQPTESMHNPPTAQTKTYLAALGRESR